ncbi:MAG: heme exporter protein CcmB [Saprospiraceae bacterium]|nr:heme exporter protein CcmB [Saprospiraceae bacterium]
MDALRAIGWTIGKEVRIELRKGYALGGLIVFVLCTVYVIYLTVSEVPPALWNALYWVAFLFLSIHTVLKSFAHESSSRYLYYYTLMAPETLFAAKCIYNAGLLTALGLLMYGALSLIGGHPVVNTGLFITAIVAGGIGISLCFTLISGIAIKSDNGATLMTVLSFPVIIPVLLNLVRLSEASLQRPGTVQVGDHLLMLGAIDLLLVALGLLLFPYLWRS